MKKLLLGTTVMMGLAAPAFAGNNINIDISGGGTDGGTVKSLAIEQDQVA